MSIERSSVSVAPGRAMDGAGAKLGTKGVDNASASPDVMSFLSLLSSFGAEEEAQDGGATSTGLVFAENVPGGQIPPDVAGVAAETPTMGNGVPAWMMPGQMLQGRDGAQGPLKDAGLQVLRGVDPDSSKPLLVDQEHDASELMAGHGGVLRQLPGAPGRLVAARAVAAAMAEKAERMTARFGIQEALDARGGATALNAIAEFRTNIETKFSEKATLDAVALDVEGNITASGGDGAAGAGDERAYDGAHDSSIRGAGDEGRLGSMSLDGVQPDFSITSPEGVDILSPEQEVAERVRYWIANDVQNAELTLDSLGQDPIEVSISLQGGEARVAFRTDAQDVRQVLEGAATHLKEMLASQGLILSGVSVGASGAGGSGHREQLPPRQGVRQAVVSVSEAVAMGSRTRPAAGSGRGIDVFV